MSYFLGVLVRMIMAIVFGSLTIGLFAFLVAGKEGFVNGLIWGAAFGVLGGLAAISTYDGLDFWHGFFRRYNKPTFEEPKREDEQ